MKAHSAAVFLLIVLFTFILTFSSCGDDDDDSSTGAEQGDDDDQSTDDAIDDDDAVDDDDDSDDQDDDDNEDDDDASDDDDDNDDNDDDNDDDDTYDSLVYVEDLPVLRLKGDAYTRGYEIGRLLGDQIVGLYEKLLLQTQLGYDPEYTFLFRLVRPFACSLIQYTDEEMEQIYGITDGARDNWDVEAFFMDGSSLQLNENDVCIGNVLADLGEIACSSVSAWGNMTGDGESIIARNLDWEAGPDNFMGQKNIVVVETPEDESWSYVSVTFPGFFGCLSCMNGDGDAVFVHDTNRWHDNFVIGIVPRSMMLRRALIAAQGAADDFSAFENVIEADRVDTGNNFHFVRKAVAGQSAAGCFEVDDNEDHPDGHATLRTDLDTDVNSTELTDVLFATNHYRKRYPAINCGRYNYMVETVEAIASGGTASLTLDDLHNMMIDVEFHYELSKTIHTVLFKPSDWSMTIFRIGADHWASEDDGVTVPPETLFPWGMP